MYFEIKNFCTEPWVMIHGPTGIIREGPLCFSLSLSLSLSLCLRGGSVAVCWFEARKRSSVASEGHGLLLGRAVFPAAAVDQSVR
jgi:hypothetical protein